MGKGTGPEVSDRSELQIDRRPTSGEGWTCVVRRQCQPGGRARAVQEFDEQALEKKRPESVTYVTPRSENVPWAQPCAMR